MTNPAPRIDKDEMYLRVAETIALRGTCRRRKVGCVLVDRHGRILAAGYNGVPTGRVHCLDEACPGATHPSGAGLDLCEAIHAEQNAILLLSDPWAVDTVYVTATPCVSCMKLLLGTSATRIVARELYPHLKALAMWENTGRTITIIERTEDGTSASQATAA